MASRRTPYVEITRLSPRKRKPSRSPSPNESSRASTPNLSPRKKTRFSEVDDTTSRISRIKLSGARTLSRPLSPTVSDFNEDVSDFEMDTSSGSSESSNVVFEFEENGQYVLEQQLFLHETLGEGIPIRRLREFTLFKCNGLQLISAAQLLDVDLDDGVYGASGIVSLVNNDDTDSDSVDSEDSVDDGQRVKILKIVGFNVHDYSADEGIINENIFIQTVEAWYILDTPSRIYQPLWTPFCVRPRFCHLFLESLDADSDEMDELLTESAFKSDEVVAYLIQTLFRVIESGAPITRVPLIRALVDRPLPVLPPPKQQSKRARTGKASTPKEDSNIFVTPVIGRVVMKHLLAPVSVVGDQIYQAKKRLANELQEVLEHHEDPESMRWGEGFDSDGSHSSVVMDGVTYRTGDVVAVKPGTDGNANRASNERSAAKHCINTYANSVWFIQILRFFNDKRKGKMFHGQWFLHGSRTILEQVTHTQELFGLYECDDVPVATIYQKCDVRFLEVGEVEEPDQFEPNARNYFYRKMYDETTHAFSDFPDECRPPNADLPVDRHCVSCGREAEEELLESVQVVDGQTGLAQHGVVYHVSDFVYVKPAVEKNKGVPFFIAQVTNIDFENNRLSMRYYKKHADDPRRIYKTRGGNDVAIDDLEGVCFVRYLDPAQPGAQAEIDSWIEAHGDNFYTNMKERDDGSLKTIMEENFDCCQHCFDQHCDELEDPKRLVRRHGRISVLELFAGGGGLSQGLTQSGFFTTEWAVERSVSAANTFRANHPETKVLCVDINEFLRYCTEQRDGKNPVPLRSTDGTVIPDDQIPHPGDFQAVCGGPPCQSFSRANSHQRPDDPRSALPFTMLSVAELFQPDYFLLENVTGLLQHSVSHDDSDKPMKKAMLKLILRGLNALDYQVDVRVLQAGQYGAPQDRERVIFLAAKRGCPFPKWPLPMYAFFKAADKHTLLIKNDFMPPVRRGKGPEDHIFAPHASITVNDAIGDLVTLAFTSNRKNPHRVKAETPADVAERQDRVAQGIQQFDASEAPVGFRDPIAYATEPMTRYQRAMRKSNSKTVENHVTNRNSPVVVESTTLIPLIPLANHRSLPPEFLSGQISTLTVNSKACYGRLDGNAHFKTAMTTAEPRSRGSYLLHPTQKRPISVVEAKRGQGFPDDYILCSDETEPSRQIKDYYRHIGNAVPVPLAAALGRSLEAAFVERWKQHRAREQSPIME
ncbi:S-adenosyl-L-methionine-dependent methyltransferase [Mycena epipterygia]|nr:S-adenosyl-L-methionine-dependent methyltransferase [Mycena epipterygia]